MLVAVLLMIGAQSAFAQTGALLSKHPQADFKSGYDHGVADASEPCNNPPPTWIDGYVTGFCKISGPDTGMDEDEADFDCNKGPSSAGWMIGFTVRSGGVDFHRDPMLEKGAK
jgi:hypothetical protein